MSLEAALQYAHRQGIHTNRQFHIMLLFRNTHILNFRAIHAASGITKPATSRALDLLCSIGLLQRLDRHDNPDGDMRHLLVGRTDHGRKFIAGLPA